MAEVDEKKQTSAYRALTADDIISYCQEHGEVEWLKATAAKTKQTLKYPRVNGKIDKTQEPKIVERPLTFIEFKRAFVEKFIPEILPKKKPKSFREKISAL